MMETPRRSSDEISRLYARLAEQMSAKNEEEIGQVHRELLRIGAPIGAIIVGRAKSSVHKVGNRSDGGGAESPINELLGAQRVSVELQQGASEATPLQRPPGIDVTIDRSECDPVVFNMLGGADSEDRPLLRRAQTVPTQVTSEAETTELAAVDRAGDVDIHHEAFTETTDDPRLITPAELRRSPSLGSGRQLRARLLPAAVGTRAILVFMAAVVAPVGTVPLWRAHRPADEYPVGVLQPAVVSPPTLATAVVAAGFSEAAVSAAFPVASARLSVDARPTVTMPSAVPENAAAIAAAPVDPTETPVSPLEVDVLQRGDTLLAAGEVASAGLSVDTRPTVTMPNSAQNPMMRAPEDATAIAATPAIVPTPALVPPSEVADLLQRGDALLAAGDVASARLFYERAAMAGDATAALRLGGSYDALFLARAGLTGVHSNRTLAALWYRRADELGAREAKVLLRGTETGQD